FNEETLKKFYISDCNSPEKPMYKRAFCLVLDDAGENVIGVSGRTMLKQCELCGCFHNGHGGCSIDNPNIKSYPKWLHYNFSRKNTLYNIWNAKQKIRK